MMLAIGCNGLYTNKWVQQHNEFNDHWITNIDIGYIFRNAYIDTAGNTWAISASGIILYRSKGGQWAREELPVSSWRFYSIAGRGNEVWVSGEDGLILYKKIGHPWVQQEQKAGPFDLNDIYIADNDVWIVGSSGVILHKKDTLQWQTEKCPDENTILMAIKGTPDNLWIIGRDGVVLHRAINGTWLKEEIGVPNSKLTDLLVQKEQVWVTGENGLLLHRNKASWSLENTPANKDRLDHIFGWDDQVWMITDDGQILYKNGNEEWRIEKKLPVNGFIVGGYAHEHDIWLAGSNNLILHKHENDPWVQEDTPAGNEILTHIAGSRDHLTAVGFNETILDRNDQGQWMTTHEMITHANLNGIYSLNDEVWVSDDKGNILYKNKDNDWQKELSGLPAFEIIDGYQFGDDIWLIGKPAAILHKHGNGRWMKETFIDKPTNLQAIYGQDDKVWVAGTNNLLLYKNSGTQKWVNDYTGKNSKQFFSITGMGDDLYALGSPVTILHKKIDQPNWVQEAIDPEEVRDLNDVHVHAICKTDSGLYAVGDNGLILYKKNQGTWKRENINGKDVNLKDIAVMGETVWAAGNIGKNGVVLYKKPGEEWVKEERQSTNFLKIIKYRGLCFITKSGYLYKENDTKNYLTKQLVPAISSVAGAAVCSGQLYFVAENSVIKVMPDQRRYPTISRMRHFTGSFFKSDSLEIQFTLQVPPKEKYKDLRQVIVQVFAKKYNDWRTNEVNYLQTRGRMRLIDTAAHSYIFAVRFEIAQNLGIVPTSDIANKLAVKVIISSATEGITEEVILKNENGDPFLTVTSLNTLIGDFWNSNSGWLIYVSIAALYYALLLLIWLINPLLFLKIYNIRNSIKELASLKPPFDQILIALDIFIPMWPLAHKGRVLDAWIKANKDILVQQFRESIGNRSDYIPMPIRVIDPSTDQLINEPNADFCTQLFHRQRTIVQLIGQGGAGKTMLMAAMGDWMTIPHQFHKKSNITRIPVLIDSDTTDLLQTLKELFHVWFNMTKVNDDFLIALLKEQRLVVMVDAFSERSIETQTYFNHIHASLPVNALFITTRQEAPLQVNEYTRLYLIPFDPGSLVHFITQLLEEQDDHPLRQYHDRIRFAREIINLTNKLGKNNGVTPMLVKLIIDYTLSVPDLIPKIYYDYLGYIQSTQGPAQNILSLQQIITAAEEMALLSVRDNYIPRDFTEHDVRSHMLADTRFNNTDPIACLIANGVITRRSSLGIFYLRFNWDTMAEYLGASCLYDKHRDDPEELGQLIDKVNRLGNEAAGFKMAFEQIKEYKLKYG
jgi:photosystem II stability/assembly factor-like uncharacterized protein